MAVYRCLQTDLGASTVFESVGNYEAIEGGRNISRRGAEELLDYGFSGVEKLAASNSINGAIFAQAINIHFELEGFIPSLTHQVWVYSIDQEPDYDLSDNEFGDFALMEEVRFDLEKHGGIEGHRETTVTLPSELIKDIYAIYYTPDKSIHREWAWAVREQFDKFMSSGQYTSPSMETPDPR